MKTARARPETFVAKVQVSVFTTAARHRLLVYDELRRYRYEADAEPTALALMAGRYKAFFWAQRTSEGKIELLEEAPWQSW